MSKQKSKIPVLIIIISLVSISIFVLIGDNEKSTLEFKIINYISKNYTKENLEIRLSDFTDFAWDKVIIFGVSAS